MKRVGLTGGIGCGKTTVLREFALRGVPVFAADQVAASYYNEGTFKAQLQTLFGADIVDGHDVVDKKKIASIVFTTPAKLAALNALIHPRVISDFDQFCLANAEAPYVMFESAILYEYDFDKLMDYVVAVYLDYNERIRRVVDRDGSTEQQIVQRISNQLPAEEVMSRADYVILNYEGNPRKRQVEYIHSKILSFL